MADLENEKWLDDNGRWLISTGDIMSDDDRLRLVGCSPELLEACKAVLASIIEHHERTGDILWINPPFQAHAVHESAAERLQAVVAKATACERSAEDK